VYDRIKELLQQENAELLTNTQIAAKRMEVRHLFEGGGGRKCIKR
jgi:hypothetical protein